MRCSAWSSLQPTSITCSVVWIFSINGIGLIKPVFRYKKTILELFFLYIIYMSLSQSHSLFQIRDLVSIIITYVDFIDFKLTDQDIIKQDFVDQTVSENMITFFAYYPLRCIPHLEALLATIRSQTLSRRNDMYYDETELMFGRLMMNRCVPESFFERNFDIVNWKCLSQNVFLSVDFLDKYWQYIDFDDIGSNMNLTLKFILKFYHFIRDWKEISENRFIPEEIFSYHVRREGAKNSINWEALCRKRHLSVQFIQEFEKYINWISIYRNECIEKKIKHALLKKYKIDLKKLAGRNVYKLYKILSYEEIDRLETTIGIDWINIETTKITPLWFFRKYKDELCWDEVIEDFNSDYIEEFRESIAMDDKHLSGILDNTELSDDFREKNIEKYQLFSSYQSVAIITKRLLIKLFESWSGIINEIPKKTCC